MLGISRTMFPRAWVASGMLMGLCMREVLRMVWRTGGGCCERVRGIISGAFGSACRVGAVYSSMQAARLRRPRRKTVWQDRGGGMERPGWTWLEMQATVDLLEGGGRGPLDARRCKLLLSWWARGIWW